MRILTGIQPSGALHLGNYFGAMRPAIELQTQGEAFYFIANYHSMTSLTDPKLRRRSAKSRGYLVNHTDIDAFSRGDFDIVRHAGQKERRNLDRFTRQGGRWFVKSG